MQEVGLSKAQVFKEISFAKQIIFKDPYLSRATHNSVLAAVMNVASIGLTLNPAAAQAYLISRKNKREQTIEAHLMPSYRGFIYLMVSSGAVKHVLSGVVYEKDFIEYEKTNQENPIIHRPTLARDRGEIIAAYAVATMPDGAKVPEVMRYDEITAIRDEAESYKYAQDKIRTPWGAHFGEMAKKTVIRRLQKYIPATNSERLLQAIELDNQDHAASYNQVEYIDRLLPISNISPERYEQINARISTYGGYSKAEAERVINFLLENPVDNGVYNQKQLDKKISDAVGDPNK